MKFSVVIPSGNAANLVACVRALLAAEPELSPQEIIVVEDGSRAGAEASLPAVHWITGITPFIFSRNSNLGITMAGRDVILLNDDANLITPRGFSLLVEETLRRPDVGLCSAGIRGLVGNPPQIVTGPPGFSLCTRTLA